MDEWPIGSKSDDLKDALAEVAHDWRKGDPQGMLERVTGLFREFGSFQAFGGGE